MRWLCAQIGAREHYAVPRALRQVSRSVTLYTDFWAGATTRLMAKGKLRSLAARRHPDLDAGGNSTIISWNIRALLWENRRRKISAAKTPYHGFIEVGERFSSCVRNELKRQTERHEDLIFYAYDTGALESLEWCREHGTKCVLNQMDPNRVEVDLVHAEEKQWPGWALQPVQVPEEYFVRREREWALADRVVVNSEFSRRALIQQGVPAGKLVVIPLCFETTGPRTTDNKTECNGQQSEVDGQWSVGSGQASHPLRVLFLGQVILRKGIQYLMEAAKLLEKENIQFDVVGPIGISRKAMATAPGNLTFHGRAGRDDTADWYRRSNIFVLPTLSDGFAITQLEAMAYGLPVVTTSCCGEVVTDGVDGFVVVERNPMALATAFQRYLHEPELLASQSAAALEKSKQFSLDHLAVNLVQLEAMLRDNKDYGPRTKDYGPKTTDSL